MKSLTRKPKKKSITKVKRKGPITEEERQEMLRMFNDDLSVGEIARMLERSSSAIGNHLHDMLDGTEEANNPK